MVIQHKNLDEIKTLEEAKQEISLLLETQKKAYYFLYLFSYSIKELMIKIIGFTELLSQKEDTDDRSLFLEHISSAQQRVLELINTVGFIALHERMKFDGQESTQSFQPELIELKSVLMNFASQIQEFANHESAKHNRLLHDDRQNVQVRRNYAPIQTYFHIDDNLPTVQFDPQVLREVISDIIHFLTQPAMISELAIDTTFSEEAVVVTFSCSTPDPYINILNDGQQFATTSSIFELDPRSLILYKNWLLLKQHRGMLTLNIQNSAADQEVLKGSVTISIQRHDDSKSKTA